MERDYKKEMEGIVNGMKCPKDFQCYKSGFEVLCKATTIAGGSFLVCLEKDPRKCEFSLVLEHGYFCECPLRIYIAKKLKK